MTLVHLAINFCLSALTRRAMTRWTGKPRTVLSWKDYLRKVAPTGEIVPESLSPKATVNRGKRISWLVSPSLIHKAFSDEYFD